MKIFDTCLKIEEILKGYLIASNKQTTKRNLNIINMKLTG